MLALGVLFAPITKLFGVNVTWNLLLRLAPAVSACAMCLVLRRWTSWWPAAFVGGLLYGFSSYQVHASDYVFLVFVPLPPVFFLLLHEVLVRQKWSPRTSGLLLGLVCVLQFFIFPEVLAGMVVVGAIAVLLYVLTNTRLIRVRWRYVRVSSVYAIGLTAFLLTYPVAFTLAGPQHIHGPPDMQFLGFARTDLCGAVSPGTQKWSFGLGHTFCSGVPPIFKSLSTQIYIGFPLLIVLTVVVTLFRNNRSIRFAAVMAFSAFVLSLGTSLMVNGYKTGIPLPLAAIERLPELRAFQPQRFSLFAFLFVSAIIAIALDEVWTRAREGRILLVRAKQLQPFSKPANVLAGAAVISLIATAVILPGIPASRPSSVTQDIPAFFTSSAVDVVPRGSVLLQYPYPDVQFYSVLYGDLVFGFTQGAMIDQAAAGMRYQLIGGYGWFPSPITHDGTTAPAVLDPLVVQALFDEAYTGGTRAERSLVSRTSSATLKNDLRTYFGRYHVETVVCVPVARWQKVLKAVTSAIGLPVRSGGVYVWRDVHV